MRKQAKGFTLVELLIVVVIMAVLAATVIPEFTSSTVDAKKNTSVFNLQTLRSQVQTYRAQHGSKTPATLSLLTQVTNKAGATTGTTGDPLAYGPYIVEVPEETISGKSDVAVSAATAPMGAITGTVGGWIYAAATGEILINHEDYDDL
jgi:general secretion pathway protein G